MHSCQWKDRNLSDFIKNIFICILKMKKKSYSFENSHGWEMTEYLVKSKTTHWKAL